MLLLHSRFKGMPVASMQAGHRIAVLDEAIINPETFAIEAFFVKDRRSPEDLVLHTSDIRGVSQRGVIVDHDEQIMSQDDLVRLKEIIDLNFQLVSKPTYTERKHRLGKVSEYVVDSANFKIMKIHVQQSVLKNISSANLVVARSQIVEITDKKVVVQDAVIKEGKKVKSKGRLFGRAPLALNPETSQTETD